MRPKGRFRAMRIRHKMYSLVALQLAMLVLAYVYSHAVVEKELLQRLTEHNSQLNHHNLADARDALAEMKNLCATTLSLENPEVNREMERIFRGLNAYRDINLSFRNTGKTWTRYFRSLPYVKRIQMCSTEGPTVYMDSGKEVFFITVTDKESPWVTEAMGRRGDYYVSASGHQLMLARAIINPLKYEKLGVIAVEADMSFLMSHFESGRLFPNQRYWFFIDGVLAAGDEGFSYEQALRVADAPTPHDSILIGQDSIYVYRRAEGPNQLLSLTEIPYNAIFGQVFKRNLGAIGVITLYVLCSFAAVALIVRSIFRSLKVFERAFGRIERGEFGRTVDDRMEGEFGTFIGAFNRMSVRLKQLIDEVYEKNLTEHKLELQMLRSQINPHFFYNTLEALRMNSCLGREEDNVRMIEYLGEILRYGVSSGTEPTRLKDEIAHLERYVRLHNLRCDAQIELRVFLPPDLMDRQIIRLVFQPLVENSIRHAMPEGEQPLSICVTGYREGSDIVFTVSDDGGGLSPDEVDAINAQLRGEQSNIRLGIGLRNVNRRIQLFYGDKYGLEIQSERGQGTEIIVRVRDMEGDGACA